MWLSLGFREHARGTLNVSSRRPQNRHRRPIASHSERVFVRAKLLDPLAPKPHQSCTRTNEPC
jgi:hypothetical protein